MSSLWCLRVSASLRRSLVFSPDSAQNLAAQMLFVRIPARHHASRRCQDVDSHPAQHARNIRLADVDAASGPRNALNGGDHRLVACAVLQVNLDSLLDAFFGHLEVGDVALFFQDARDFGLQLGSRHVHLRVAGLDRVPDASQHVGNGIARHISPTSALPASLHHAWNLAIQSELAETQAANAELAQERPRAPAAPAAVAVAASQLGRFRLARYFQLDIPGHLCGSRHISPIYCFTAGTAFPFGAAAPRPRRPCAPWW